jgi:hypothetical protein
MCDLGAEFEVLVFAPSRERRLWTYATAGMSQREERGLPAMELHLMCQTPNESDVELLTAIAHYHLTGRPLGWGHTVSFGRPWRPGSRCTYGLISLPYLDGPELEWFGPEGTPPRFLWLVPITGAERNLVIESGVEALESRFDGWDMQYADPLRSSVA